MAAEEIVDLVGREVRALTIPWMTARWRCGDQRDAVSAEVDRLDGQRCRVGKDNPHPRGARMFPRVLGTTFAERKIAQRFERRRS